MLEGKEHNQTSWKDFIARNINGVLNSERTYGSFGHYMPIFQKTRTLVLSFWYSSLTMSATEQCLIKR